ncbi:reverse transcriptase domain-containing protein [Tanacetum coccineum]
MILLDLGYLGLTHASATCHPLIGPAVIATVPRTDVSATSYCYSTWFNELALMCPRMVEPRRVKVYMLITRLTDNIKGEVHRITCKFKRTGRMASQVYGSRVSQSRKLKNPGNNQKQGNARAMVTAPTDGKLPLCERCFTRHVSTCTIKCHKCGKVVELVNHIFEIDLMLIELGTFDVIIGMDWLVKNDAVIVCGKKCVHIPYENKTLVVEGDKGGFRLKVISCIKARKTAYLPMQVGVFGIDLVPGAYTYCTLFIDDILIYSKNDEEHEKHLMIILELLKEEKLYAKFIKCDFWLDLVQFQGHVIDHVVKWCIHVDLQSLGAIKSWAAPTTPMEIKNHLLAARSRQKSYADKRFNPLEFEVGDMVLLKVSPWNGVLRFEKRRKLSPRYIGPFKVLARIGPVAYTFEFPEELKGIHNTFHVLNLKKVFKREGGS